MVVTFPMSVQTASNPLPSVPATLRIILTLAPLAVASYSGAEAVFIICASAAVAVLLVAHGTCVSMIDTLSTVRLPMLFNIPLWLSVIGKPVN